MNEMVKYSNYKEYKEELDIELQKTAEGFVRIGYLLKKARDTDILAESGYKNYIEFAQAEYSIDKTTVSRFIRINDKFAEGGNSEILMEQYRGFGYAKLAIMLQLPEEVNNIVTPDFSKSEILTLKEEIDEEKKKTDIEIMLEETDTPKYTETNLDKVIWKLGKDEPELYIKWYEAMKIQDEEQSIKKLIEILAPAESKIYMLRLQGVGKMALSIKTESKEVTLINIRSEEKEIYKWQDVYAAVMTLTQEGEEKESWQQIYGEPFPEEKKTEVAPVQRTEDTDKKENKIPVKKTQSKVAKAKVDSHLKKEEIEKQQDEQVVGQKNIMEYPEYLPDKAKAKHHEEKEYTEECRAEIVKPEMENNLKIKLVKEAEKLADQIEIFGWEEKPATREEIKKAKEVAVKLVAVLEQLLSIEKGEPDE